MEVGKLVTTETCGNIFYFVVDETHPDEPQRDASKCYYVVAPASSTFSYREAYYVLCRALCGLDNRTYLHRWHSLHEQIFGTTPYVQFVNAVRNSPFTQLNSLGHAGGASPTSPQDKRWKSTVTLPALFLDETTARLVLRNAEREREMEAAGSKERNAQSQQQQQPQALSQPQRQGVQHGCSTPVSKPPPTTHVNAATAEPAMGDVAQQQHVHEAARQAMKTEQTGLAEREAPLLEQKLKALQQDLRRERRRRLEAEERCLRQTQAVEEVRAAAARQHQPPPSAADHNASEESAKRDKEELKETTQLHQRIRELEAELADTQVRSAEERNSLVADKEALKQQLWQQSQAQGAQIKAFLKENSEAVGRVERALEKREAEVCAVYARALEERDVRIAQLSQEVLQNLQTSRQLTVSRTEQDRLREERVAYLEDIVAQLKEWNTALREQLNAATHELHDMRERLWAAESGRNARPEAYQRSPSLPPPSSSLQCNSCAGLPRDAAVQLANHLRETQQQLLLARTDAERKSQELTRAAHVIEQLTRGVQKAKLDVEAVRHQYAVNVASISRNPSPTPYIV
jgi:DNA repair exonuclease SbcCD ATPase subunit